ncbi:MAG TPA: hypothetical protein VIL45_00175 [Thermoplasmata archaeon]
MAGILLALRAGIPFPASTAEDLVLRVGTTEDVLRTDALAFQDTVC